MAKNKTRLEKTGFSLLVSWKGLERAMKEVLKFYQICSMSLSLERDRQEELVSQAMVPNTDNDRPRAI